jgi:type VI secretion system secreted protein Hcp
MGQQSAMDAGSGGGAGKCTVDDLILEHYIDRSTPNLVQHCLTGKHIESGVLVMRKAGGKPLEYLKITMGDVLVTEVKSVCNLNMRLPRERFRLSFARVSQEYVVQNAQGGSAGVVRMAYDIKGNKVI